MTEPEDPQVRFKRYQAFMGTELGRLYLAHENALIVYWQANADDSSMKMMELDKDSREATHAFVTKLMELAGV
jgi:hypothetical protein